MGLDLYEKSTIAQELFEQANKILGFAITDIMFEGTAEQLKEKVESILQQDKLDYVCDWTLSGKHFLTPEGELLEATCAAITEIAGINTDISTAGGTSDGRFIAPTGTQVVELGPLNETIHKIDECVKVEDLDILSKIYQSMLEKLLA